MISSTKNRAQQPPLNNKTKGQRQRRQGPRPGTVPGEHTAFCTAAHHLASQD
ncbi:unnamed protein product [Gulo gulo]|uniref:Uncharacterized protein n=1 Tax=Gulo gulo TaxID=48420 RepID=A0A9X9LL09_GULGU|nr:unnamed protein product [Gulo gulo]